MFEWFKTQFDEINSPILDWVQVEITTCCNSACIYCPHTTMEPRWANRHMSLEFFHKLIPFIRYTKLIYLQGWGEPLLNHNIFEMIRMCKEKGKLVGFTTNGMLLSEEIIRNLIDLKVDILGISLAGTTAITHNRFRQGTDFDTIVSNLQLLGRIREETRSRVPALHLAYLMLRSNFHELQGIVPLAKMLGAQQIVTSNMSLIVEPKLSAEAIFNDTGRTDYYRNVLEKTKTTAARDSIIFAYNRPDLNDASQRCSENVYCSCVINVEGEVVPCVFTNPVLCGNHAFGGKKSPSYIFKNRSFTLNGMPFGNIHNENLTRIWHRIEYARFRELFNPEAVTEPDQILSEMPESCIYCYKRLTS